MSSYAGKLLVATPQLRDPNFRRSVVLLLDHDEDGTLGVTINRRTETSVGEVLPRWSSAVSVPGWVYEGGPVGLERVMGVAQTYEHEVVEGFEPLWDTFGLVDLDHEDPRRLSRDLLSVRIFAGHSGWGPGQLEAEVDEGSWYVVPSVPGDLLCPDPDRLWGAVLRRQPGPLAYVASYPDDPSLN